MTLDVHPWKRVEKVGEAKLRILDLFSGIGGFSLGLERTGGFETVAFCEMKPHARAVLAKHWPDVPAHDDVTTYDFKEGEADVITAGFPCQDISFAGDGAGLAGSRSGLYREVIRAIRVVRPLYAVLENVAALLSRGLGTVLGDLAAVGYDAEWHCIPASAVGAPHRRDRIWIVANPGGERHEGRRPPLSGALAKGLSEAALANARHGGYGPHHGSGEDTGEARSHQSEGHQRERLWFEPGGGSAALPDANAQRELQSQGGERDKRGWPRNGGQSAGGNWATEPRLGRVADGVPDRLDRLEELGNAVVPQIPELIGNAILASRQPSLFPEPTKQPRQEALPLP